jgi:hypothetical protein
MRAPSSRRARGAARRHVQPVATAPARSTNDPRAAVGEQRACTSERHGGASPPARRWGELADAERLAAREYRRERYDRGGVHVRAIGCAARREELSVLVPGADDAEEREAGGEGRTDEPCREEHVGTADERRADEEGMAGDALDAARLAHRRSEERGRKARIVREPEGGENHPQTDDAHEESAECRRPAGRDLLPLARRA